MRKALALVLTGAALAMPTPAWAQPTHPGRERPQAPAASASVTVDLGQGVTLELVKIPPGRFLAGSTEDEAGRGADETAHVVGISDGFYIGVTEVTVGAFTRFVAETGYRTEAERGTSGGSGWDGHNLVQKKEFNWKNPGYPQTDRHPVTLVTYDDAQAFAAWLTRTKGRTFALPTEAEWEYVARAGSTLPWSSARDAKGALSLGWFKENAATGPRPVGERPANAFGVHDMFGNAAEWCLDVYAPYPSHVVIDPLSSTAPAGDKLRRVLRGGSWHRDVVHGRAGSRYANAPGSRNADNGFRVRASLEAAAAPTPSNGTRPASPTSPTSPASKPSPLASPAASSSGQGLGTALLVFLGAFGLMGIIAYYLVRRRPSPGASVGSGKVGFRLAPDGFWLDAASGMRGSTCRYRVRTASGMRDGEVELEGLPEGQFIYVGERPLEASLLELLAFAPSRAVARPAAYQGSGYVAPRTRGWVSAPVINDGDDDDGSPAAETFGGFPSAY